MPTPGSDTMAFMRDFGAYMKEYEREILQLPSIHRNYLLKTGKVGFRRTILLTKDDGQSTDLSQFTGGALVVPSDCFQYEWKNHVIRYDRNSLGIRGAALMLLHEAAHAMTLQNLYNVPKTNPHIGRKAAFDLLWICRDFKLVKPFDYYWFDTLGPNQRDDIHMRSAREERIAWIVALANAARLEDEGFNVIGEFGRPENLQMLITYAMLTHEFGAHNGSFLLHKHFPAFFRQPNEPHYYADYIQKIITTVAQLVDSVNFPKLPELW